MAQGGQNFNPPQKFTEHIILKYLRLLVYYCKFESRSSSNGGSILININNQIKEDNKGDYIIEGCIFNKCSGNMGGSIYIRQTKSYESVRITNTIFKQSSSNTNGGALYYFYDDDYNSFDESIRIDNILENCTFSGCTSSYGGAIYFTINDCFIPFFLTNITFSENRASEYGGALFFNGCNLTIENSHFIDNFAVMGNDVYYAYMNYNERSNDDEYFIKKTKITGNKFTYGIENSANCMLYFNPHDYSSICFLENKIKIIESNLQSEVFSALYFDSAFNNYKITDNNILPYNEKIAVKFFDKVNSISYNFTEWFPNYTLIQMPTQNFTESVYFTKSSSFSSSFFFSKTLSFSDSFVFTKSSYFSNSIDFAHSKKFSKSIDFTNAHYFSESSDFSESTQFPSLKQSYYSSIFSHNNPGAVNIIGKNNQNDKKLEIWIIVLIVIAILILAIIVIIIIIFIKHHNKKEEQNDTNIDTIEDMGNNEIFACFENPLHSNSNDQEDPFDVSDEKQKDINIKVIRSIESNDVITDFENPLHSTSDDQEDLFNDSDEKQKDTNIKVIRSIESNNVISEFENPLHSTSDDQDCFDVFDEEDEID